MVQETQGSIIDMYASLITIPVHVHVVHFSDQRPLDHQCAALIRLTVVSLDVGNCLE